MRREDEYLGAYRSLKLTRDGNGVLVAESHTNGGTNALGATFEWRKVDPKLVSANRKRLSFDLPSLD